MMNKATIIFLTFILSIFYSNNTLSQSIKIINPVEPEVTLIADPEEEFVKFNHKIQNVTFQSINIKTKVNVIEIADGHLYSFCDLNQCYPYTNQNFESSMPFTLASYESTDEYFYIEIKPNGISGLTKLHITFFNEANESDSIGYTLIVDVATSLNELNISNQIEIYPNPASDYLIFRNNSSFNLNNPIITIYNNSGEPVLTEHFYLHSFMIIDKIEQLSQGLYFYELKAITGVNAKGRFIIVR